MAKVSVIVPVYNVSEYLHKCLDSLVEQTLEDIEIIIVNDGSTDNCQDIIDEYKGKYPNKIYAIKQENGGIGSARNTGLEIATGEYVGFVDSDDYVDTHMFEKMYNKAINDNGDICVCGFYRVLDNTLVEKGNIVKPCFNNNVYNSPELFEDNYPYVWNKIIKRELIVNNRIQFEAWKVYEDLIFTYTLFLYANKIVQITDSMYYYRVGRKGAATATFSKKRFDIFGAIESLISNFIKKDVAKLFSNQILFIVLRHIFVVLETATEAKSLFLKLQFLNRAFKYLENNFPDWMQNSRYFEIYHKPREYYVSKQYWTKRLILRKNKRRIYNEGDSFQKSFILIDFITLNSQKVTIEGRFIEQEKNIGTGHSVKILMNGEHQETIPLYKEKDAVSYQFELNNVQESPEIKVELAIVDIDNNILCNQIKYGKFSHLSGMSRSYYFNDGYSIVGNKNRILIRKCGITRHIKHELSYYMALLHIKKFASLKIIAFRLLYYLYGLFQKKSIWILSDRSATAKDNGMHLFNYIIKNNIRDKSVYFAIDKNSKDYAAMKVKGKILALNSMKYKLMFLRSNVIASSHANRWVVNAFGGNEKYYRDLYRFNFVFLQHGVLEHDLSEWLKKTNKNIKLLVTSNRNEYNSIICGNYGYTEKEVQLLGLPRHDNLKNIGDGNKTVLFMPTWRKHLTLPEAQATGISPYNNSFKESSYYKFYNDLINDQRLLTCFKEKGYKGIFVLHPSHISQKDDYNGNDIIEVKRDYADYQALFNMGSLMVTDYSSVAIDFAYLKRPIIYTQFDIEEFYAGHLYSDGHYDFEKDGFGDICTEYEETVARIITCIENSCIMDKEYQKRVDLFFEYNDGKNCERVYNAIINSIM